MRTRIIMIMLIFPALLFAQSKRKISHGNQVWLGDFSKGEISSNWSLYMDFGLRRADWVERWSQTLIRVGITRKLNKNVSITAGGALFNHYAGQLIKPEYRGWQQLLFPENYGRLRVAHRLRIEQRFSKKVVAGDLVKGYSYNNRFRYQLSFQFALNKSRIGDKTLYLAFSDEVMINSGKEIIYNYFDQNRTAGGLGYKWNDELNILVSYMNVFIQRNAPATFETNNMLVINAYHDFSLLRKQKNRKD